MEGAMSVSAKHSRFHQAVISAAGLMILTSIIAETLPFSAEAQMQTAPTYPYLQQQQPTAQGTTDQLNREERASCSGLRLSALRPEIIAVFWPTIGETVRGLGPTLGETKPGLSATDLQSSG
jgi:hypothetical protein